jgi:DNA-binding GntR family transcriptional regulator
LSNLIQAQPLYEQVYKVVRDAILTGKIKSDEQINEVKLAKDIDVSRGPVREAVRKLEQEGLLVRKKNSLYVYKTSKEDLTYIYQCRKVLESFAVRLATENLSEEIAQELTRIINTKEKVLNDNHVDTISEEFTKQCILFHDAILKASGNPRLIQQVNQLRSLTRFYRNSKLRLSERRGIIFKEHLHIFRFIQEGNSKRASTLMEEHLENDLCFLLKHF